MIMFVHRSSKKNGQSGRRACYCSCVPSSHKVAPCEGSYPGYDMVETSEGRVLRVRHINAAERDANFEDQKKAFIEAVYKKDGPIRSQVGMATSRESSARLKRTKSAGPMRGSQRKPHQSGSPSKSSQITANNLSQNNTPAKHRQRSAVRTATDVNVANISKTNLSMEEDIEEIPFVEKQTTNSSKDIKSTPIFMFHGVGGSADVWSAQIEYFENLGYELIVPDLIGHGDSSVLSEPSAYSFNNIARDLMYLFDKYCNRTNIILAHSYGASFACYIAHERPSWVSHLVLISGGSPTPLAPQPGVFMWPTCCLACCLPIVRHKFNKSAFHEKTSSSAVIDRAFDVSPDVLKYTMNGQDWPSGDHQYHNAITAATLVLHGEGDLLITVQEEEEMSLVIPNSEMVVIEEASHMVMMEKPARVNKLISEFLLKQHNIEDSANCRTHPQVI